MSVERFFTTTLTATRMDWDNESSAEISNGTFKAHMQQATPEDAQLIATAWGKTFFAWCAKGTDVQPGDSLSIATGDYAGTYSVKNVQKNATGNNQHLQLTLIKDIT